MDRLVKNEEVYMKIESQLDDYKYKRGLFGHRASLRSYMDRVPITWWDNYGDEVLELKAFATKILGLTCSASACERNLSTFNQVHTKRRNRLGTDRMNKLVYVMYNRRLKQKFINKTNLKDDEDPIVADEVLSDNEWIANPSGDEDEDGMVGVGRSNEEEGESSSRRKKKRVINLVDEDDDADLNTPNEKFEEEDDDDAEWNEYYDI
ncbi:uncharacterized protein LOC110869504 [Helianthus annuus]|uniref:uncharacterized protein LOC110869504 n=1 Tax=Helianthus annuus TaxID=4232 RepID=UPI000B8F586A|nr:uncharacterized protein LOC110869504 [Helianthus annuus]